jgi:hypothetical protein
MKARLFAGIACCVVALGLAATHGQAAEPGGPLMQIKVQPDKAPDCSSLKSIVDSITRDCKTNDEKAIAIYNFCMLTLYHRAYPSEPGGIPALKLINCYGWSLCGGLHSVESALWTQAGWEHRFVGWDGHTTVEARYDGRWHYLDVFLKFYAWQPDGQGGRTIASEDELTKNSEALVKNAFVLDPGRGCVYAKDNQFVMSGDHANWRAPAFLSCGDTLEGVIAGLKTHHTSGPSPGWAGIEHATGSYSTDVNLAPGWALTNSWDPVEAGWFWASQNVAPAHTCPGHKDTRNDPSYGLILEPYVTSVPARSYASGRLTFTPDLASADCLRGFAQSENVKHAGGALLPADPSKPAWVALKLESPYLLIKASGQAEGAGNVELSTDDGKTYQPVELKDFSGAVKGKMSALVKIGVKAALKSLNVGALVQNNPGSLPYLSPGKNVVAVSVADPQALGDDKLVVTYAYKLGSRSKSFDQLCDQGKEIARQHNAQWSDEVTYVQQTFAAKDLPGSIEIDCPTPAGKYPVYPRMLFVRREVLSAAASPLALPAGVVAAKPRAGDQLATLPNPFLIGSELPEPVAVRPLKTQRIPLRYLQFCDEQGQVSEAGLLAWPKNAEERGKVIRGAVLIDGDLGTLPKKNVASARLVVPVVHGHSMTSEKLGVVFSKRPLEKGKPCDFADIDSIAGSAVVPLQPRETPEYRPAKPVAVDVTRSVKEIAAGEKFNGLVVRIVPDRGIDDGYTVRCKVSPVDQIYLEVDTYSD